MKLPYWESYYKLSKEAIDSIKKWDKKKDYYLNIDKNNEPKRLSWDEYFIQLAVDISKRSPDSQTKHGAILVNDSHEIIATGYNGFLRDVDDSILPNFRPDKYKYMIHAEKNILFSCARQGKSTLDKILYITGKPCDQCLQCIWQAGIKEIIYGNYNSHICDDEQTKLRTEIITFLINNPINNRQPLKMRFVDFPKN